MRAWSDIALEEEADTMTAHNTWTVTQITNEKHLPELREFYLRIQFTHYKQSFVCLVDLLKVYVCL